MKKYFIILCVIMISAPLFSYDLTIDLENLYRPVTQLASGSLYGLRDEGRPSDTVINPTKPFMFVQPAANGEHAPYSYPSGTGDILDTAHIAARNGATVTMRMADTFPTFPYNFTSLSDWTNRVNQMITDWQNSGNSNLYGYEIYNEPNYTYNGSPSFYEVWQTAYNIIRQRDPGAKIIGPSTTHYNTFLTDFLRWTKANNCYPDIVCWHELGNAGNVQGNINSYKQLQNELGMQRPLSINEYVSSDEDGMPGKIVDFIATFERNLEVESACLPFWSTCGSMGNILTSTFQPNGAWHVFKWYGDMNGSMVWTKDPASMIDGFSSINNAKDQVYVIFGGADNQRIVINNVSSTNLGTTVHVYGEYTEWVGINTVYNNPRFWFEDDYNISNNQLILNVNNLNEYNAYRITISSTGSSETPEPTSPPTPTPFTDGNILVRARGTLGGENMELQINGNIIASWTMTTDYQDFYANATGNIELHFTNDDQVENGMDIQVDYIIYDNTTYQAEDQETNTAVYEDGACGGSYSEWLHCDGYIQFNTGTITGTLGDADSDGDIDIVDALLVAQFYVDLNPNPFNQNNADTDCDGDIDIVDALLIAQYYVNLIAGFC